MRKYYNEEIGYFLLPETKVYKKSVRKGEGNSVRVPGLVEIVLDLLKSKQNLNKDQLLQLFKDKDIVRKGGSYEDTDDNYLFNQYFGGADFRGAIPYEEEESLDDDEAEHNQNERRYEQFEQELRHFLTNSGVREAKHVNSYYDVHMNDDGGGEVYYYAYGSVSINVEDIELEDYDGTPDELEDLEGDQLKNVFNGGKKYEWQKITDRKTKFYRVLYNELKKAGIEKDDIKGFQYGNNGYTISMEAHLQDYNFDNGQTSNNVDEYPHFLRTLMDWDGKYEKIKIATIRALSIAGYADLSEHQKIQYGIADYDEKKREFSYDHYGSKSLVHKFVPKNLKFEGDWASFILQTGIKSTYLYNLDFNGWQGKDRQLKAKIHEDIKTAVSKYLQDKMSIHYTEYEDERINADDQKSFKFENYNFDLSFGIPDKYNRWVHFNMKLDDATKRTHSGNLNETPSELTYKVSFEAENRNMLLIQGIDTGIDDVRNIIKGCFIKNIVPEDKYTSYDRNILRTYSIYLSHVDNQI